ncbi:hypothetical protein L5515_012679 [Caenorhabditis briggsae]|uniref:Uncharacterized protein n=1 Tax=Caenorhabditis briggsae TaxID=6238 RepID=A0AAE9F058_CAEBR|nr:hypothetical protein L5515_012679 [Caenorhabditis briggsae]
MARLQKEPDLTFFYVLKRFIIFLINPLWFTITCVFEFYTYLRPFRLCHFMFWHCIIWIAASHLYVVGQNSETVYLGFDSLAFFILLIIGVAPWAKVLLQVRKPKVQNLNHVILGFFGMISLLWIVFGCFLGMSFNFYYATCARILLVALLCCFFAYIFICNIGTHLYLILPPENQPFSGIKLHVVLFGLFHLAVFYGTVCISRYWPACSMLLLSSFVFSINAWSCFFTPSYHLCEHRRNEWDMHDEPFDGIIRHVAVRRNLGKMKDPMNLPTGFQFDDQLDVSKLQYRTHRSFMY